MWLLLLPTLLAASATHPDAGIAARDALLFGDLERFQAELADLEALPAPTAPDDARAWSEGLAAARAATDVRGAATALATVAQACGACHEATGAAVPRPRAIEARGDGVRAEMARHDRALGLVWSGLVRPSKGDLRAGAEAFEDSFLTPRGPLSPAAAALDEQVTTLAGRVATRPAGAARSEAFGAMIATCQACHAARPGGLELEPD